MTKVPPRSIEEAQAANWLDVAAVRRVVEALRSPNIEQAIADLRSADARQIERLLGMVHDLEMLQPGFTVSVLTPVLVRFRLRHEKERIEPELQRLADEDGWGQELAALLAVARQPSPNKGGPDGLWARLIAALAAANNVSADEATKAIAERYGVAEDSISRSIRRSAKRRK